MSDKDKLKQQTEQIFNIAEKPIMEYVCNFLDEPCSVVFKDEIPIASDPLILLPIDEYKKEIYLKFTLKTVTKDHESNIKRIADINDIIHYQRIKESIGFLVYCIKTCYPSIIVSGMINYKTMGNIILELNETDWSFTPIYSHDLSIKKKVLEETLNRIIYMRQNNDSNSNDEMLELNKQYTNIISEISKVQEQLTPEILELENQINNDMLSKPIIGIFVEEITKNQLPKKNSNLKPISDTKYIEADK